MKPGEVSQPVRTPTGFHIVKLNEVRSARNPVIVDQIHARHILMRPNELQDDATVRQKLAGLRERILKGEDFAGIASTCRKTPGRQPMAATWAGPARAHLMPEFESRLNAHSRERDQRAVPAPSSAGTSSSCSARRTFDSTEDVHAPERALPPLRESKADEETELWLRRLRDEAFVEVRNP